MKMTFLTCKQSNKFIEIQWEDEHTSKFHNIWLRDNCVSPSSLDKTGQKVFHVANIPESAKPISISIGQKNMLTIDWSDGHQSLHDLKWLRDHCYSSPEKRKATTFAWKASDLAALPTLHYDRIMKEEEGVWEWLQQLQKFGVSVMVGVPTEKNKILDVARRISYIRNTMYGEVWDVASVPDAINIAYTSLEIDLHQDLLYYESPPGLQFLHCIENEATGGESVFLDGYKAAEILKSKDRDAFNALSTLKTTYHKIGTDHDMQFRRPIISLDEEGQVQYLNYSPPFSGPLNLPFKSVETYYAALRAFTRILKDKELRFTRRFKPGELVSFNNRRVFHGRGSFDPSSGNRLLQGTYVDSDEFYSRYKALERQFGK
eukprot:TRINITY_DN5907_c0_g1_i1.p1 TRINITY_DN5907_c0_g1~~TRINITY_DN5907_c0_g1_i1.p1  ORF type:complete len:374 (+),score=87.86 TRINITY_DN5907_c0_g1_i1:219-1340(+)